MIRGIRALESVTQPVAEKLIKSQEQINQLHEVLSTLRLDKQNALVRRLVRKTQDGTLGQVTADEPDDTTGNTLSEEELDKVSFGDTTTYNVTEPTPAAATKTPSVIPYVLAAALGGTGLGAAAMALPYILKTTPAAVQQADDTDTQYTLDFKKETNP